MIVDEIPKPELANGEMQERLGDALHTNLKLVWNVGPQRFYEEEWRRMHGGRWKLLNASTYSEGR